jgi:hypothetical protein
VPFVGMTGWAVNSIAISCRRFNSFSSYMNMISIINMILSIAFTFYKNNYIFYFIYLIIAQIAYIIFISFNIDIIKDNLNYSIYIFFLLYLFLIIRKCIYKENIIIFNWTTLIIILFKVTIVIFIKYLLGIYIINILNIDFIIDIKIFIISIFDHIDIKNIYVQINQFIKLNILDPEEESSLKFLYNTKDDDSPNEESNKGNNDSFCREGLLDQQQVAEEQQVVDQQQMTEEQRIEEARTQSRILLDDLDRRGSELLKESQELLKVVEKEDGPNLEAAARFGAMVMEDSFISEIKSSQYESNEFFREEVNKKADEENLKEGLKRSLKELDQEEQLDQEEERLIKRAKIDSLKDLDSSNTAVYNPNNPYGEGSSRSAVATNNPYGEGSSNSNIKELKLSDNSYVDLKEQEAIYKSLNLEPENSENKSESEYSYYSSEEHSDDSENTKNKKREVKELEKNLKKD